MTSETCTDESSMKECLQVTEMSVFANNVDIEKCQLMLSQYDFIVDSWRALRYGNRKRLNMTFYMLTYMAGKDRYDTTTTTTTTNTTST